MNDVKLKDEKGGKFSLIINGSTEIGVTEYSINPVKGGKPKNMPLVLNLSIYCNPETSTFEIVPKPDKEHDGEDKSININITNRGVPVEVEVEGPKMDMGQIWDALLEAKRKNDPRFRQLTEQ